jgi:hypothetical protein
MKVHMFVWNRRQADEKYPVPSWFKDNEDADITMDQVMELYNLGHNIMLKHMNRQINFFDKNKTVEPKPNEEKMMLAIDWARFNQR